MAKKSDVLFTVICFLFIVCLLFFKFIKNQERNYIFDMPTDQAFLQEHVKASNIEKILYAGINTPSGLNKQPWHFCVVSKDNEVSKKLENDLLAVHPTINSEIQKVQKAQYGDAPLAIHVYCDKGGILDASLALAHMNVAAHELGYGTKIVGLPAIVLKGDASNDYKQIFKLPLDCEYVSTLLIGKVNREKNKLIFDAISGATSRKPYNDVVTFPKKIAE